METAICVCVYWGLLSILNTISVIPASCTYLIPAALCPNPLIVLERLH